MYKRQVQITVDVRIYCNAAEYFVFSTAPERIGNYIFHIPVHPAFYNNPVTVFAADTVYRSLCHTQRLPDNICLALCFF